jgi:hypothetical protein
METKNEKDIAWLQFLKATAKDPLSDESRKLCAWLVEQNAKGDPELSAIFDNLKTLTIDKAVLRKQLNREFARLRRDKTRVRKFSHKQPKT